ncbi:2-dehydropantoate 2-reductase N-terminal domain-containing protein [Tsukamurella sp. NPDC003166]|uniref:ketopantoate reductase family protein n=1 Tax=Tsukamurella sp. NPDC003166 TaxID=3154444 RepID=UPI0033BB82A6
MTRYVIVGAGAVGSALAAELTLAGIDSVLVARGEQLRALSGSPLRYLRPDGTREIPVNVAGGPADVRPRTDDVLVLAVKAQQASAALADWAPTGLPLVTLQNGLDTERIATRYFDMVIAGSILTPAQFETPGTVAVYTPTGTAGLVWLGPHPDGAAGEAVESIARDFTAAAFPTQVAADIGRWKRAKLLANLGNAIEVFDGTDAEHDEVTELLRAEALEAFAAAGLDHADYGTESRLDHSVLRIVDVPGAGTARRSTWQSLARGAGSVETDYLNGEIVHLAHEFGTRAPANRAVQVALWRLLRDGVAPGTTSLRTVLDEGRILL